MRVGQVVLVHAKPVHAPPVRFRSAIRGWHTGDRIILDRPGFGSVDPIHEGCPCIVRFIRDGTACAFRTFLTHWLVLGNTRWCHVDWPPTFEAISFRKHPRVPIHSPCTIRSNSDMTEAFLRDISAGGCGLLTQAGLDAGREVLLDFLLPTGAAIANLRSIVRNVRLVQASTVAGCEFLPEQSALQNEIALFINRVLARQAASPGGTRRLLIIDSSSAAATALNRLLEQEGCQTFGALTAIDGFTRLRTLNPAAVAVNFQHGDMPGDEVVRLIKSYPACAVLPVFLFGPDTKEAAERARAAGATRYFPVSAIETDLAKAMLDAAQETQLSADDSAQN